jgi:cellobiose epimerase
MVIPRLVLALAFVAIPGTGAAAGQTARAPSAGADTACSPATELASELEQRVLPFWSDTVDAAHGGYAVPAPARRPGEAPVKQVVTQARLVWGFSRAHRAGFGRGSGRYLRAAESGYRFLVDRFRDPVHGGYYWTTDPAGRPVDRRKILYGQAFVLYGLTEYYRASGDPGALDEARRLFAVLDARARDRSRGGWLEHFEADWRPILTPRQYLHVEVAGLKSANAHLHMMEALSELVLIAPTPSTRAALAELLDLNTRVFFPSPGSVVVHTTPDWREPDDDAWRPRGLFRRLQRLWYGPLVSYGHNVEFAWLARRAERALERPADWRSLDDFLGHALAHGFDHERGGVFEGGYGNRQAHLTNKIWWPQAEMLTALTVAIAQRPQAAHVSARARLLDWLTRHQADPATRVWRETVRDDGAVVSGTLAHHWKANYHDLRAILEYLASCGVGSDGG